MNIFIIAEFLDDISKLTVDQITTFRCNLVKRKLHDKKTWILTTSYNRLVISSSMPNTLRIKYTIRSGFLQLFRRTSQLGVYLTRAKANCQGKHHRVRIN